MLASCINNIWCILSLLSTCVHSKSLLYNALILGDFTTPVIIKLYYLRSLRLVRIRNSVTTFLIKACFVNFISAIRKYIKFIKCKYFKQQFLFPWIRNVLITISLISSEPIWFLISFPEFLKITRYSQTHHLLFFSANILTIIEVIYQLNKAI